MNNKSISIIMRSKNSDWVIASALSALYSQSFSNFELTVIDSGSTDSTLDIIKHYPCKLVQIPSESYYPGQVLNDAIQNTTSEIIVFLNSDSVMLSPHSLEKLVSSFRDPLTAAAFGRQAPRPEADTWVRKDYASSFPLNKEPPTWLTLSLPLAAIRRKVWDSHNFYTKAWASEDTEWGQWALNNGYRIRYEPKALTMHSHNYTLKQIRGRRYVEGEADAFIYKKQVQAHQVFWYYCKSVLSDFLFHTSERDLKGLLASPFRRFVFHWSYWRGNLHGNKQQKAGDTNTAIGQQVVLRSQ